jgi:hypothetical protein
MMPLVLAALNLVVLLLLLISAWLGFRPSGAEGTVVHMYWGVGAALVGLLGHSLTMFFFMATGRAVKEACRDHKPAWPLIARSHAYRRLVSGRAMIACTMLIAQPVLGAAVHSGRLAAGWHQFGFWVTLAVQAWVAGTEVRYLGLNNALLNEVAEWRAAGIAPAADPPA